MLDKVDRTQRGFEIVEFEDMYNQRCSLQQSSIALYDQPGSGAIWLGRDGERMHLKDTQVKELVEMLQRWLDTGSFESTD